MLLFSCQSSCWSAERALDGDDAAPMTRLARLTTIGDVTWWSHDAVGYHPAIYLKIENTSGVNLSGMTIRFQGRFTDLRNGYVTVAREDIRRDFANHQQISVMLRGPHPFELPIDENAWPAIECKAMCRIGDIGDEGTEDLVVTRLDHVTMTDEEALAELTKQTGLGRGPSASDFRRDLDQIRRHKHDRVEQTIVAPTKALMATAGNLLGTKARPNNHSLENNETSASNFALPSSLPALGDDFYLFEKYFGVPAASSIVASKNDLTWVGYPGKGSFGEVYVGSRGSTGKADILVVTIPVSLNPKEGQLLALVKLLAGKGKAENLPSFVHSVRYLPGGRSEIARSNGHDVRVISFRVPQTASQEAKIVLAVSRLQADLESTLAASARRVRMMEFFLVGLAQDEN
jgi:hypothetical protein